MTSYHDWVREGEAELAAMREPTAEEDAALALELDRENAEQAEREEEEMAAQEEGFVRTNVTPIDLVFGEFVEIGTGQWVRADKVRRVAELPTTVPGAYATELDMAPGEEPGTGFGSQYPARTVLAALNLALENGRQRRVERADY